MICQTSAPRNCVTVDVEEPDLKAGLSAPYWSPSLELRGGVERVAVSSEVNLQGDCYTFTSANGSLPYIGNFLCHEPGSVKVDVECPAPMQ
jgi:hypothetical protein